MKIIEIAANDAARLVPLLQDVHALHVAHQPARHIASPRDADLAAWTAERLARSDTHALAAQSPQGELMGYLLYAVEERPALPVRAAERRVMLHEICVAEPFRRMGIGKALIAAMKERAAAGGISVIATTNAPFNTASAALMAAAGLEPVLVMAEWRG